MIIKDYKKYKWVKHWAGSFNVLYDTLLGLHNTTLLKKELGVDLPTALYIYRKGYSFAYFKETDYRKFGLRIAGWVKKNPAVALRWSRDFMSVTDKNMKFMKAHLNMALNQSQYQEFTRLFNDYSTLHRPVKVLPDFLPAALAKKLLPTLSKARVHAEPVYEYHEKVIRGYAKAIAKQNGYSYDHLLALTNEEIRRYQKTRKLPSKKVLADRYVNGCVVIFHKGKYEIITGKRVVEIEHDVARAYQAQKELKGTVAYPGRATGKARIIFDPRKAAGFRKGDILVTGMTRPEFLSLMKQASAFVTDAGGMLSHAAIVARELKKPCVIGTQVATKTLKDGDLVEVDATKGIVKILERAGA